jgi:hypothetical protein
MSYVRTKEKVISLEKYEIINENGVDIVIRKHNERFKNKTHTKVWNNGNNVVVKQSNTIEELCDAFVGINDGEYQFLRAIPYKCANYWNRGVYGCIWTNKGLQFVAKLNDKGEFELC